MPEEPRAREPDRGAASLPSRELAYLTNCLAREFPGRSHAEISAVVETAKVEVAPSIASDDVLRRARERLRATVEDARAIGEPTPRSAQPPTHPEKGGSSHHA